MLLNSTPEETLAHRIARNRDRNLDSPFTTMVLNIEQEKLKSRAGSAAIIVTKDANVISYEEYLKVMGGQTIGMGPMLNAYPDSIGGKLSSMLDLLENDNLKNCFESFYVLPSIYNTDLDRGFSVINYNIIV